MQNIVNRDKKAYLLYVYIRENLLFLVTLSIYTFTFPRPLQHTFIQEIHNQKTVQNSCWHLREYTRLSEQQQWESSCITNWHLVSTRMHIRRSLGKNAYQNGRSHKKTRHNRGRNAEKTRRGKETEWDKRFEDFRMRSEYSAIPWILSLFFLAPPVAIRVEDEASGYAPSKQSRI